MGNELDTGVWAGASKDAIMLMLKKHLKLDLTMNYLLADINNQSENADRLIDADCIFKWVQENLSQEEAYEVFYDEDRAADYEGQEPDKPKEENFSKSFLSMKLLVKILTKMGF